MTIGLFKGAGLQLIQIGNDLIQTDVIGTDISGNPKLGNQGDGVFVSTSGNTIGGAAAGCTGDVVSGNSGNGIEIAGSLAFRNVVQRDIVGMDPTATRPVRNGGDGVSINASSLNTIGGSVAGSGDVISGNVGNLGSGSASRSRSGSANFNVILGNDIDARRQGRHRHRPRECPPSRSDGNLGDGVRIDGTNGNVVENTIGGLVLGAGNVISDNGNNGIEITGSGGKIIPQTNGPDADNQTIIDNFIGTDSTGEFRSPNGGSGIRIFFSRRASSSAAPRRYNATSSRRTRTTASRSKTRARRRSWAITSTPDADGIKALGNIRDGIAISFDASSTIGGTVPGAGATSSSATAAPGSTWSTRNSTGVQGNVIGVNPFGAVVGQAINRPDGTMHSLGNEEDGITLNSSSIKNIIGGTTLAERNVISGNLKNGISMINSSDFNVVEGNLIGLDPAGTWGRGNNIDGIYDEAEGNTIGGTTSGAGNVISGNLNDGLMFTTAFATGNVVEGNLIGTDPQGGATRTGPGQVPQIGADNQPIGNRADGIFVANDASKNLIGGTVAGAANVISGNGGNGVQIFDINFAALPAVAKTIPGDVVQGNIIGLVASGMAGDGNGGDGVMVNSAKNDTIGRPVGGAGGNVISANGGNGVEVTGFVSTGNARPGQPHRHRRHRQAGRRAQRPLRRERLRCAPEHHRGDGPSRRQRDLGQHRRRRRHRLAGRSQLPRHRGRCAGQHHRAGRRGGPPRSAATTTRAWATAATASGSPTPAPAATSRLSATPSPPTATSESRSPDSRPAWKLWRTGLAPTPRGHRPGQPGRRLPHRGPPSTPSVSRARAT